MICKRKVQRYEVTQGNNSPMPGCGQSFGQGLSEMNDFGSRGWGLRVERVNNRGRYNGRGMGQGQELSPHNSRNGNGNGHGRDLLVVGFPPFG